VLVARLDSLGDVLLAGPAVRAVAAGAEEVVFLCSPTGAPAARLLPGVARLIELTAPWIADPAPPVQRADLERVIAEVRAAGVDEAVILTSFHQSPLPLALLLRLAGVPRIAAASEDYPGSLLDVRHLPPEGGHEVTRACSLTTAAGYPPPDGDDGRLHIRLPDIAGPAPLPDGVYVVVHPGASVPARTWAPERFAAAAALLAGSRRVVVTGGRSEADLTAAVAAAAPGALDLGGRLDVPALARVLASADAVVVGNTGPAHLAAAVGTPVVSLFAPTVPADRWRPWGVPHVLLGDQAVTCAGCRARRCPFPHHPCLGGVSVDDVVAAVDHLAPVREERPA
jgi:ADP-heptose:LPS heptosyltransferase